MKNFLLSVLAVTAVFFTAISCNDNSPVIEAPVMYYCFLDSNPASISCDPDNMVKFHKVADSIKCTLNDFCDSLIVPVQYRLCEKISFEQADAFVLQEWSDKESEARSFLAKTNEDLKKLDIGAGTIEFQNIKFVINRHAYFESLVYKDLGNVIYSR